jgi:hypothetical protein
VGCSWSLLVLERLSVVFSPSSVAAVWLVGRCCRQAAVVPRAKIQYQLITFVEHSGDAMYFLAISYCLTMLVALRKLWLTRKANGGRWEPESIFVASVLFASVIRFLSFSTISILSFQNVHLRDSLSFDDDTAGKLWLISAHDEFYSRVTEALFSVGDFVFLTAYMMLVRRAWCSFWFP